MVLVFLLEIGSKRGYDTQLLLLLSHFSRVRSQWNVSGCGPNRGFSVLAQLGFEEMAPHSSTLAWRIPGAGEPGGLPSMGSHMGVALESLQGLRDLT